MFACILNMKPENVCVSGVTIPSVVGRDLGGGAISIKQSSNSLTPKLFNAEPKKAGVTFPDK